MNLVTRNGIDRFDESLVANNTYTKTVSTAKESLANNLSDDSPENKEKMKAIDKLQLALDVIWFEPTYGTIADIVNTVISLFRSALATESDERKRHIINAWISAISIIPFADVIKLLKLRKSPKVAKNFIKWARVAKRYAKRQQAKWDRFAPKHTWEIHTESYDSASDPYAMAA
jgi:hypothetical protein